MMLWHESQLLCAVKRAAEIWHAVGYFCPHLSLQYNAEVCEMLIYMIVCVFISRQLWEWGESVSRAYAAQEKAGSCAKESASGQWPQVHGHLPETTHLLLTLPWIHLVSAHICTDSRGSGKRGKLDLWEIQLCLQGDRDTIEDMIVWHSEVELVSTQVHNIPAYNSKVVCTRHWPVCVCLLICVHTPAESVVSVVVP